MSEVTRTTWPGGFVRHNTKGEPVYVLHKMFGGKRWKKTLGAHTEADALAEWV